MVRETSIEVYHRIKSEGLLSTRRLQVYETLFHHGPLTQNEAYKIIAPGTKITQQSIGPRFAELLKMGVIQEISKRTCSVSGNVCLTWDVTKKIPVKIQKVKLPECTWCKGSGKYDPEAMS